MKTKKPNMTWLECLIQVRKRVALRNVHYICNAIDQVLLDAGCWHLYDAYRDRVEAQLYPNGTYGNWLKRCHPEFVRSLGYQPELQPGRLAWIDNMIKLEKERLSK